MSPDSPPPSPRPPHPLAVALIERLRSQPRSRVVELGAGSGRNTRALRSAGLRVVAPGKAVEPAAGALSTHDLLHGTPASIARRLRLVAGDLAAGAPLFATFGSVRDARYGQGAMIEPFVFAPTSGDECGVAHAYFDEARLRQLIEPLWIIDSIREVDVDAIAGTWAHPTTPLHGAVHWFVGARKR